MRAIESNRRSTLDRITNLGSALAAGGCDTRCVPLRDRRIEHVGLALRIDRRT